MVATGAAFGQPYNAWLTNAGTAHGYVQLPPGALNFTGGSFTFEAWVSLTDAYGGCSTIAGTTTFSRPGSVSATARSALTCRGGGSAFDGGVIPVNDWTHIAVTFDETTKTRRHYVDGELVGERVDDGSITASSAAWRIFSDVAWEYSPSGGIDEVRFWTVARTQAQIRSTINTTIHTATPGLVSVYAFDTNANDSLGTSNGTKVGASANYLNSAISSGCTTNSSVLCVGPSGRFQVIASYKTASTSGFGGVVPFATSESGLFTFFSETNWEAMVKVLNACSLNNRWWVFAAGMTDQHVELEVTDLTHGVTKRYFNYFGTPFAPINDVEAFATCP